MEGSPLMGEPSQKRTEPITFTELFRELCPVYMAMGMTYNQFWHCNTKVHKAYRESWEIKRRNEEWARHRQGAYIYDAMLRVAPVLRAFGKGKVEPGKYPDEPWPLTQEEADERKRRDAREKYYRMREKLMVEAQKARQEREESEKQKEASRDG